MKKNIHTKLAGAVVLLATWGLAGCNDFLDREPLSDITPDKYFTNETDLATYTVARYSMFPTHSNNFDVGTFGIDNHTDNQATSGFNNRWVPGELRVPQSGGSWDFSRIREMNYYLQTVVPRWKEGRITGSAPNVGHYVGEGYFLRAYEYFNRVQALGDFPILRTALADERENLIEASKRRPRNEVARFIIADLDSAISLLQTAPPSGKNRISKNAALLFKSRVALHEATWLTYHRNTAHVPGGPGWPGAGKIDGFTINLDAEVDYFLTQAMEAAKLAADAVPLVSNLREDGYNSSANPYFAMFSDQNMEKYSEVLMWRQYDPTFVGINNNVNHYLNQNGGNTGYTRGLVDNFLMKNGLPIYATGSGYKGDDDLRAVKQERDNRLQLFMKAPGELRLTDRTNGDGSPLLSGNPDIVGLQETRDVTGYSVKKGLSYQFAQTVGNVGTTGSIVFRGTEAYLNYIEASYLKEKTINATADRYWRAIRERAGVNPDYTVTVAATVIEQEAKNDFAAYSAGRLLTDPILYNIRRERRNELIAEGMRYYDLKRWRAMDQLKATPYIIEGFKIWGPLQAQYAPNGTSVLIEAGTPGKTANVSKKSESLYLRPYRINLANNNLVREGYRWAFAHYLDPIATQHFLITSSNGDLNASTIYQNPGWPTEANVGARE
ncbi:RagB/SusD family nutrient uptake outer membrane protein (plasmid) [Hymenobacter tibetensis]|uniref:RagB/SusD family nutrient uptake outer membrane protein n=1 Tax=Hymenobacter tibetensis TaxID=497967 RepID=A0ABY4D801_9BACT|nr:RagB/SusD family nutrient uptake outer membrane protein [Hymenobacter tibetensis]UOG77366.1 RagB/SusD family nutrient uptake outer membrane protein [Hymenobacter tibetensis]